MKVFFPPQGTVFFPLPDGTGLLFNLTGTAEAPRAVSKISRDVPCKTAYTEVLSITNWLNKPQRFKVNKEMVRPDKLDPGTSVKGLDYIDVPGNAKRDYKLTFNAHKEGQSTLKVRRVALKWMRCIDISMTYLSPASAYCSI